MTSNNKINQLLKTLGPGLLYAGAAIGVSHLVQSTKAGAQFGYGLVWAVILANILKYPFFEFGPRYAAATGKSLLYGYKKEGKLMLVLFIVLTLLTMFIIQAAVTIVTAGLASFIFGIELDAWIISGLILLVCGGILLIGKYSLLDKAMKVIVVVLSVTTIAALSTSFSAPVEKLPELLKEFNFSENKHIFFLIALVGWMPAPLDISVWHSVWSTEKFKLNKSTNMKEALLDFRIGYWGTAILAICFVGLGANMMHGTTEVLDPRGSVFAQQLLHIYTSSLGDWAYYIIAIAAFTTMFSTTLTCLDAFPRVLSPSIQLLTKEDTSDEENNKYYRIWLAITILGSVFLLAKFTTDMGTLVDFATTMSFVTAPIFALMNMKALRSKEISAEDKPSKLTMIIAYIGLIFLIGFSLFYLLSLKLQLF